MGILNKEQTTAAVRGLIYFGAHDFQGDIDLGDCQGRIKTTLEPAAPPSNDKDDPVEELMEVVFGDVVHGGQSLKGEVRVRTKIRWPSLYERLRVGSPHFSITQQPDVRNHDITRNFLVAFSRLIRKHTEEVDKFKAMHAKDADNGEE